MRFEVDEFTGLLETQISSAVRNIAGAHWDEDHITFTVLAELNDTLANANFSGRGHRREVEWESYKLRGKSENKFGDIAIVVAISYRDGTHLEGVAFLEAKRRDWRKTTFSSMNMKQLKRILKNAPRANYLLYDYEDITGFSNYESFGSDVRRYRNYLESHLTETTRALCVPLNVAEATGFKDTILYRHGIPLSMMLTNRYFFGLDLEFDETAKAVATGFLDKFGLPRFVMKVDIVEPGAELTRRKLPVNEKIYEKLGKR